MRRRSFKCMLWCNRNRLLNHTLIVQSRITRKAIKFNLFIDFLIVKIIIKQENQRSKQAFIAIFKFYNAFYTNITSNIIKLTVQYKRIFSHKSPPNARIFLNFPREISPWSLVTSLHRMVSRFGAVVTRGRR